MAECKFLRGCPFFNDKMPIDSAMGKIYKNKYCLGEYNICARYKIATQLGKEKVPVNLYPNMFDRAEEILVAG